MPRKPKAKAPEPIAEKTLSPKSPSPMVKGAHGREGKLLEIHQTTYKKQGGGTYNRYIAYAKDDKGRIPRIVSKAYVDKYTKSPRKIKLTVSPSEPRSPRKKAKSAKPIKPFKIGKNRKFLTEQKAVSYAKRRGDSCRRPCDVKEDILLHELLTEGSFAPEGIIRLKEKYQDKREPKARKVLTATAKANRSKKAAETRAANKAAGHVRKTRAKTTHKVVKKVAAGKGKGGRPKGSKNKPKKA